MQKHWDVMRSDNAGDHWHEVSGNLPTDFGFVIDVHAHEPETIYVVPIKSDSEHFPLDGKLRVYRSRTGGNEWEPLTKGLPQSGLLRQRPARCHGGRSRSIPAASTSAPPAARSTSRPTPATTGHRSSTIFPPCSRSRCRHFHDPQFCYPQHLRTLAQVHGEITLEVAAPITQRSVLDALEDALPHAAGHHPRS